MIQLAEDIEYLESRKVPLDPKVTRAFIEIASSRKIDIAVVDTAQLKAFDESETGDDVGIDWVENTRTHDFEYEAPDKNRRYLLFWNSNEYKDAIIAYKITPLT